MRDASSKTTPVSSIAPAGVVLSFDDYSDTWIKYLPLLESLGIKTTFFITGDFLRDAVKAQARLRPLVDAGHSLGVHTFSHRRATEMWKSEGQGWLNGDVLDQARMLAQLSGQPVHAFAYPFGDHDDATDQILMPHFHILRTFGKKVAFTTREQLRLGGMTYATSIDNVHEHAGTWHEPHLANVIRHSRFWVVASHHIDDSKWGITPERLTQFAESARELGIPFIASKTLWNDGTQTWVFPISEPHSRNIVSYVGNVRSRAPADTIPVGLIASARYSRGRWFY